jgi:hypothetical protein
MDKGVEEMENSGEQIIEAVKRTEIGVGEIHQDQLHDIDTLNPLPHSAVQLHCQERK